MPSLAAEHMENVDLAARLRVDLPGRYRIDVQEGASRPPARTVCDGEHLWQASPDRIIRRPATPLPAELAPVLDPAWLLDRHRLSAGGTVQVDGRPGVRLVAGTDDGERGHGKGLLSRARFPYDEADVVIDEDAGVVLRLSWSWRGQPLLVAELTDVSDEVDSDAFAFEPPPGVPVHASPLTSITAKDVAGVAVRAAKLVADITRRMRRS